MVEEAVFPFPGSDADLVFTDHIVKTIRKDACCIDQDSRSEVPLIREDLPAAIRSGYFGDFCIKAEFHAVCRGIFRKSDIKSERTYDSRSRGVECGHGVITDIGFHFCQFRPVQDA